MTDLPLTRRQALLAGGAAVVAAALGASATRALGGDAPAAALQARADFLPLVGRQLQVTDAEGRTGRLALEALDDLRHARPGSERDFALTFSGRASDPWWSDVLALSDDHGRRTDLLVTRTSLPGRDGSQRYTAIVNGTPLGADV